MCLDTKGWLRLEPINGATGTIMYRKEGNLLNVIAGLENTHDHHVVGVLPIGYRTTHTIVTVGVANRDIGIMTSIVCLDYTGDIRIFLTQNPSVMFTVSVLI